jgi:UDP-N-acetylglucosamine 3-dehydrogenase
MRVGAVGVGGHASATLFPSFEPAGLDLVAVCARHRERAEAAAARWRVPHAFDDLATMLASVELDGVVICVRAADYPPLIQLCLDAGKPVYCEKPAAPTVRDAGALAEQSRRTGVPVVVGYMKRFAPAYERAREIIQSAEFGRPSLASFTFVMGPLAAYADLRVYVVDNPVHHLDLARYLVGELDQIDAKATELPGSGHALAVNARASSGAVCTFNFCTTASWAQRNELVEIYGEGHAVCIENVDTCTHRPPERPERVWRPNYTVGATENRWSTIMGFVPALSHFRDVTMNGSPNVSDVASAALTLEAAERLCDIAG